MRKIYTLRTDAGDRYCALDNQCDIFITAACSSIVLAASAHGWTAAYAHEDAAQHVLDVRGESLARAEKILGRLERGLRISVSDALVLDTVFDFLHATVAPHQYDYPFLTDQIIERWIRELGLRNGRYALWSVYDITHDGCIYPVIHSRVQRVKYPGMPERFYSDRRYPSPAQRALVARYVRSLGYVAKLFGPDRKSPEEIVAAWLGRNRERVANSTLLQDVVRLLELSPNVIDLIVDE